MVFPKQDKKDQDHGQKYTNSRERVGRVAGHVSFVETCWRDDTASGERPAVKPPQMQDTTTTLVG